MRTSPTHRGLTLLELIVSLTILAVLTTLTAGLWSQMRSWASEASSERPAVRTRRVAQLAADQWRDRRSMVPIGEGQATVRASATRFEFLTGTPILFLDWPLVRARYMIETIDNSDPLVGATGTTHRLVYEETRVTQLDYVSDEGLDSAGKPRTDSIVLFEGCSEIRFEQWVDPEDRGRDHADAGVGNGFSEWQTLPAETLDAALRVEQANPDAESDGARRAISSGISGQKDKEKDVERSPLYAVRCVGNYEKEPFEWVLIVEPLR